MTIMVVVESLRAPKGSLAQRELAAVRRSEGSPYNPERRKPVPFQRRVNPSASPLRSETAPFAQGSLLKVPRPAAYSLKKAPAGGRSFFALSSSQGVSTPGIHPGRSPGNRPKSLRPHRVPCGCCSRNRCCPEGNHTYGYVPRCPGGSWPGTPRRAP